MVQGVHGGMEVEIPADPTYTTSTSFEALFVRGLNVKGSLAEELRGLGFDVDRIQPQYPVNVWRDCVTAAARHLHPQLPLELALRRIGHAMVDGFFETLVGKVMGAGLWLLGPARYLKRFPELAKMERRRLTITAIQEDERRFRMRFEGEIHGPIEFVAGILEAGLRRTNVEPTVTVEQGRPGVIDVVVSW